MATGTTGVRTVDVVTPAAGESVTEGTILEWHVKVGDPIKLDETIVEISTDKVDLELPSPASGTVSELLVAEGDTVTVGQVIARITVATDERADGAQAQHRPPATAPARRALRRGGAGNGAAPDGAGELVDVLTPAAGESVTEGTILEWHVKVGDPIKLDETIVEISTDKVDLELPSPASGTVAELLVAEGDTVTVGQVIARIARGAGAPAAPTDASRAPAASASAPSAPAAAGVKVSPVAARAAAAEGVDLASLAGSGPAGRITKSDVLSGARGTAAQDGASAAEAELLRGGAAALARYMSESLSIPTATSFRTLTVTALNARRRELKAGGQRVSFTHLIAYAIARAAAEMPVMSEHFLERDGKPHRVRDHGVNLGLAVDIEKKERSRTLMVPVILNAGRLTFERFLDAYDALVEKARTNTLERR